LSERFVVGLEVIGKGIFENSIKKSVIASSL
jgi:hypothetical protein